MEENTIIMALRCAQCGKIVSPRGAWAENFSCSHCGSEVIAPAKADFIYVHCSACKRWNEVRPNLVSEFHCPCTRKNMERPEIKRKELFLQRYQILDLIGSGFAGEVWKAFDVLKDTQVAIKFVKEGYGNQILRAEREVQILARIVHPNIIPVYGYFMEPGFPEKVGDNIVFNESAHTCCIIMKYITGELNEWILSRKITPKIVAKLFIPIYDALGVIHGAGIVHRDMKIGNILMEGDNPIITDFGLSSLVDSTSITEKGSILGSLDYMAPEQARGKKADVRSDLYATGAMIWKMLFDKPIYSGASPLIKIRRIVRDPLPSDIETLPSNFQKIMLKLLKKTPTLRYQSAKEVKDDMVAFLEGKTTQEVNIFDDDLFKNKTKVKSSISVDPPSDFDRQGGTKIRPVHTTRRSKRATKKLITRRDKRVKSRSDYFRKNKSTWFWLVLCIILLVLIGMTFKALISS